MCKNFGFNIGSLSENSSKIFFQNRYSNLQEKYLFLENIDCSENETDLYNCEINLKK